MMFHRFSLVALFFSTPFFALAQTPATEDPDWSVLMQQEDASPDEVRALFETHWEGRERVKGSGYKQVERWLHLMDGRTDDQGHALTSEQTVDAHRQIKQWREAGRSLEGNWQVCGPTLDDITTRDNIRGVGGMNAVAPR